MKVNTELRGTSVVTWIIFFSTLVTVLISLISAVFPALLLLSFGGFEDNVGINPFEIGIWAYPLLVTNLVVLGLVFLYVKHRLPRLLTKSIKFIFSFEVSPQVTFFVITILIGSYITLSIGELFDGKFRADYLVHFKPWLEEYSVTVFNVTPIGQHVMFFLENVSLQVFGNYKVIPFIASIALALLTYFITVEISKKRFAGIVSMVIVLQSNVFLMYDTSVSYPNFWILFYLLSLFLVFKMWPLSPISFVAGVLSKAMTVVFLPMTLFIIYRSNLSKQQKLRCVIFYVAIIISGMVLLLPIIGTNPFEEHDAAVEFFSTHDFWEGFTALHPSLRYDGLVLLFLLPLTLGLFHASRRGIVHADSVMFLILGMLLSSPLIQAFSSYIIVPYRFIPLIVFFAIGVGMLLSRKVIQRA